MGYGVAVVSAVLVPKAEAAMASFNEQTEKQSVLGGGWVPFSGCCGFISRGHPIWTAVEI